MTFDEYQKKAITTVFGDSDTRLMALVLGLVGESGEIAEKFKKWLRDDDSDISALDKEMFSKELGDVLWYIAALSDELDIELEEIASKNIAKLASRKQRNKLKGSGDDR